jgi:four helix bundle protein
MTRRDGKFGFERLQVYGLAREALLLGVGARVKLKGAPGELRSQLERALVSVVANIIEGAGRTSLADQRRHHAIARGSANEAGGCVEIAHCFGALTDEEHTAMRDRLTRVTWMLTAMLGHR